MLLSSSSNLVIEAALHTFESIIARSIAVVDWSVEVRSLVAERQAFVPCRRATNATCGTALGVVHSLSCAEVHLRQEVDRACICADEHGLEHFLLISVEMTFLDACGRQTTLFTAAVEQEVRVRVTSDIVSIDFNVRLVPNLQTKNVSVIGLVQCVAVYMVGFGCPGFRLRSASTTATRSI